MSAQNTTLIDVVCKVKKLLKTFSIAYKIASVWRKIFETKLYNSSALFFSFQFFFYVQGKKIHITMKRQHEKKRHKAIEREKVLQ